MSETNSPRGSYRRLMRNMRNMPTQRVVGPSEAHPGGWELSCGHVVHATEAQAAEGELHCPQCPAVRTVSERNQARLGRGAHALAAKPADKSDVEGLTVEHGLLQAGLAALQSTDDMGSQEANDAVWADALVIQERLRQVDIWLDAHKSGVRP